jgi:integrase-like protein
MGASPLPSYLEGQPRLPRVDDFNLDAGTIAIRISKTGKPRHVVLTDDGIAFFAEVCRQRPRSEPIFLKDNGSKWRKSHQLRPMADACRRAKIDPPINFHALRHTWASLATMNGLPLLIVAKNLGHFRYADGGKALRPSCSILHRGCHPRQRAAIWQGRDPIRSPLLPARQSLRCPLSWVEQTLSGAVKRVR